MLFLPYVQPLCWLHLCRHFYFNFSNYVWHHLSHPSLLSCLLISRYIQLWLALYSEITRLECSLMRFCQFHVTRAYWGFTLKYVTSRVFVSTLLLTMCDNYHIIVRYIICVLETASWNKIRTNNPADLKFLFSFISVLLCLQGLI